MSGRPGNRPGSGSWQLAGCDECNRSVPMDQRKRAIVVLGKLRGLRGWVCSDCRAKRPKGTPA